MRALDVCLAALCLVVMAWVAVATYRDMGAAADERWLRIEILPDGTRCAVLSRHNTGGVDCDWRHDVPRGTTEEVS